MKKLSPDSIENLARKFRVDNGIGSCDAINTKSLLLKLNILTVFRPLSVKFHGISLKSSSGHCFLLINSENTRGRQHYTIAHELYHLFFEENPIPHICDDASGGKNNSERNADAFAAALLMPYEGMVQFLSPEELKKQTIGLAKLIRLEHYFSVSRLSLLYRLKSLGLISITVFDELKTMPVKESAKQYGYDTALYDKGNKGLVISDFGEKARTLYDRNIISEGHYMELLHLIDHAKD